MPPLCQRILTNNAIYSFYSHVERYKRYIGTLNPPKYQAIPNLKVLLAMVDKLEICFNTKVPCLIYLLEGGPVQKNSNGRPGTL